jgi:hypothetical protein
MTERSFTGVGTAGRRFFLSILLLVVLMTYPVLSASYDLVFSEDFIDNATLYANGWKKSVAPNTYNNPFIISGGLYSSVTTSPAGIYQPILKDNVSWNGSYDLIVNSITTASNSFNYFVIGLLNPMNETEQDGAYFVLQERRTTTDIFARSSAAGQCSINDTTIYTQGAYLGNRSIQYNFSVRGQIWNMTTNYSNLNKSYKITCINAANLTLAMYTRNQYTKVDYIRIYNVTETPVVNSISVDIEYPMNNTHVNSPFDMLVNYTGSFPSVSCSAYHYNHTDLSDAVNFTAYNGSLSNVSMSIYELNTSVVVNCSNSSTWNISPYYNFILDETSPLITLISPSPLNTSVFDKMTTIQGAAEDDYLHAVNITITNSTGSVMYTIYAENLSGADYVFNTPINSTLWGNGIYLFYMEASDSHTDLLWEDSLNADISRYTDGSVKLDLSLASLSISSQDGTAFIDPVREKDRISFDISTEKAGYNTLFFTLEDDVYVKIRRSSYPCHYVFSGRYWIDAVGLKDPVCDLVDDGHTLRISYLQDGISKDGIETVEMRSIGGLNIANVSATFSITHCIPDWSCTGYLCNLNNSASCNATTDLNSCGDPFLENMTTYFPEQPCDYCTPNVTSTFFGCVMNVNTTQLYYSNFLGCCIATNLSSDCIYNGIDFRESSGTLNQSYQCLLPLNIIVSGGTDYSKLLFMGIIFVFLLGMIAIGVGLKVNILNLVAGIGFILFGNFLIDNTIFGLNSFPIKVFFMVLGFVVIMVWVVMIITPRD